MNIIRIGLLIIVAVMVAEVAWILFSGSPVPVPNTPRAVQTIGTGKQLTYIVMGDSTAVSQGSAYSDGYAVGTATYLAQKHAVTWANLAVSGAQAQDVLTQQLPQALPYRPDVVLIGVCANDVTHMTGIKDIRDALMGIIRELQSTNADVRIILTGAPDMGSLPRIPQPLRLIAGRRSESINAMVLDLVDNQRVFFAPVATKTGPVFRAHPELFAADRFHPTAAGYSLWTPVLIEALQRAGL